MECLKCGRETDQTFCEKCRENMQKYPVKLGTVVQLPRKRKDTVPKRSKRHVQITPEMQIEQHRKTIRSLIRWILFLLIVIVLLGVLSFRLYKRSKQPLLGQNYSTVTQPTETAEAETQ